MKRIFAILSAVFFAATMVFAANPKREFRGAWLHTVYQGQYAKMTPDETKEYLSGLLDKLQNAGINAVLFQVRPSADAFYQSDLEPWSRFLTGKAGVAPKPLWDPMEFMIEECHRRGMEFHAWLNPYRVTTSAKEVLPENHIYHKYPSRFVKYDGKLYFDPGQPENRKFIEKVVHDIVSRYDVDGIHFDDYFYPYPVEKKEFPDDASFKKYGNGMKRDDWRRKNVDLLIEEIHQLIADNKPWVRFGVSPFGIWRNKASDPRGSDTNGLQNYDALYADVLLWSEKGWVDYLLPQLYWQLDHKVASYLVLVRWWNENAGQRHMYIGQDVKKTMDLPDIAPSEEKNQLAHKVRLTRELENIQGNCWWPGYTVSSNYLDVADELASGFYSTPALVPSYPWIYDVAPAAVQGLERKGDEISWTQTETFELVTDVVKYVVYTSDDADAEKAIANPSNMLAVTYDHSFKINDRVKKWVFVTALDRVNNESAPVACKVR